MRDLDQLRNDLNAALLDGFNSIDQSWREYATIKSVESYNRHKGTDGVDEYASMFEFDDSDIDSSEHIEIAKRVGRGGALLLNDLFWSSVQLDGGPGWRDVIRAKADGTLPDRMLGIRTEVTCMHGRYVPVVDHVDICNGNYVAVGYSELGISSWRERKAS